jgi:hypothetical protein
VRRRLGNPSERGGEQRRGGEKNVSYDSGMLGSLAGKLGKHLKRCFSPSEGKRVTFVKTHRAAEPFGSFGLLILVKSLQKL